MNAHWHWSSPWTLISTPRSMKPASLFPVVCFGKLLCTHLILQAVGAFNQTLFPRNRLIVFSWLPWMQQPLQVNHPGKPLSDNYALIAYQTVPINLDGSKSTHSICMGMRYSVENVLNVRNLDLRKHESYATTVRLCNSVILIKGTTPNSTIQIPRFCYCDPFACLFVFRLFSRSYHQGSFSVHQNIKGKTNWPVWQ